jgi:hypothetical protein
MPSTISVGAIASVAVGRRRQQLRRRGVQATMVIRAMASMVDSHAFRLSGWS